jgi:hypothetical protein
MFSGSLRLAADPESRVRADIEVDDERLVVRAGGDELGNWDLTSLSFLPAPGGFRLNADGEDLILTTGDNPSFAELVGINAPPEVESNGNGAAPIESPPPGAESQRFGKLRKRSAASWVDDERLDPKLAYAIMAAAAVLLVGAALHWGDARLLGDEGLPLERIFSGTAAIAAAIGAVIAWREDRRLIGAGISLGAGVIGLVVLFFYTLEAGLGIGFFLAMLAVVPLTAASVVGLTPRGIAPTEGSGRR